MFFRPTFLLCSLLLISPVYAHEFWISPEKYEIAVAESFAADFRVGEGFNGSQLSYLKERATRHSYVQNGVETTISGRNGDRPALKISSLKNGLAILVHETTDSTLKYSEFEKFKNFVKHKAFGGVLTAHKVRGLPKTGFRESYRRFAKSLIAVGNGSGNDINVGLQIEIIAQANPYIDDMVSGLPVLVLLEGKPRSNAQVELFARPTGTDKNVEVTLHFTNDMGIATLPVKQGYEYMADHVALLPLEPSQKNDPVWHSLWANLTFSVPAP